MLEAYPSASLQESALFPPANTAVLSIILCEKMQADKNASGQYRFTATYNLDWQNTGDKFATIRELLLNLQRRSARTRAYRDSQ